MQTDNISPYIRHAAERAGIRLVPIGIEPGAAMHIGPVPPWNGHAEDVLWQETGGQPYPRGSRLPLYAALVVVAVAIGVLVALG